MDALNPASIIANPAPPSYNLNQGQQKAADAFFEFLFSENKEFIISGAAGVGKTYLMNYIIDNTMPRYLEICQLTGIDPIYHAVTMTATTNKAADVLSQATKRPTQTVHSFFNLKVTEDWTNGKTLLTKTNNWRVHQNQIIFVDECSMIDSELYKVLHEGTLNCKLVYVGDHNQLAPVHESLSPVYKHDAPFYELTEPMRNKDQPALMEVCQQLRETVATGEFKPIRIVPGVIELLDDLTMQAQVEMSFKEQTHEARILAYTNKRVIQFNDHIRSLRGLPESFQPGEFLVNNTAYTHQRTKTVPVEAEVTILKNHGPGQIEIARDGDGDPVLLDVDYVDITTTFSGTIMNIPVPTNRGHYDALIKYYGRVKNWERMFFLKNTFMDLRPRDAATVHKSQGSTYDTVFVDLGNISTCNFQNQVARMLYVAFSRARNRVFLYGNLAQKYGGLILP